MNPYLALFLSLIIGAGGQILLKYGAVHRSSEGLFSLFFNPFILTGLGSYCITGLLYIYSLKTIPVSFAFSSHSISYALVAILAHYFYGETFGLQQLLALTCICFGVYLMFR